MTINITIHEDWFRFQVVCRIHGATDDEMKVINKLGLRNGGWGGTETRNTKTGKTTLEQSIYDVCNWAHDNGKSLVVKRLCQV